MEGFTCRITKDLPVPELAELYRQAGWLEEGDTPARLRRMLEHTFAVSAAFDAAGRLAGMMRALSDGVGDAYLLDLVVREDLRRRGVGRMVLETLVSHLKELGISWIVCIGAPGTETFYARSTAGKMSGHLPWRF